MNLWDYEFLGNALSVWAMAFGVGLVVFLLLDVLKGVLGRHIRVWTRTTETRFDDFAVGIAKRTWYLFLTSVSVYLGSRMLEASKAEGILRLFTILLFLVQAGLWGTGLINYLVSRQVDARRHMEADVATTLGAVGFVGKVMLWTIILLLALDNFPHIEVDTLITSLGIGGVAVALAVQNILGDLFASLSIILDKPFVIGDFINVGELSGTVERIGLKSTRVRSLTGEQLIFANSDLLESRIRNYKRMVERRVTFDVGVSAQTSYEKLAIIPELLQEIIEAQPQARFERAHFASYGDFSLNFQVVFYMLTSDYMVFMDTRQAINLEIYRRFSEEKIEMPYPTQMILLSNSQRA
jgi:small-conductance mechanosensitive channel